MKYVPNILSVSRIVISILLFFLFDNLYLFASFYVLAGLTDVFDGYIARKCNVQSEMGAKLDSAGDVFFYAAVIAYLWVEQRSFVDSYLLPVIILVALRLLNIVVGLIKYRKPVMLHTLANKASGLLVFFIPIALWLHLDVVVPFVLFLMIIAPVEELIIILKTDKDKIDLNRKGLWG